MDKEIESMADSAGKTVSQAIGNDMPLVDVERLVAGFCLSFYHQGWVQDCKRIEELEKRITRLESSVSTC